MNQTSMMTRSGLSVLKYSSTQASLACNLGYLFSCFLSWATVGVPKASVQAVMMCAHRSCIQHVLVWLLKPAVDWLDVDPMTYLTPFLTLIKASDVSGPVTGAAAVALQRILQSDLLSEYALYMQHQLLSGSGANASQEAQALIPNFQLLHI